MSHAQAGASFQHEVGGVAHALHAAAEHGASAAGANQVVSEHDGFHSRAADLVDRGCTDAVGQTGLPHGLPCGRLFQSGTDHIAKNDLVNTPGVKSCKAGLHGVGTQCRRRQAGELPLKAADGGSCRTGDEDTVAHDCSLGVPGCWVASSHSRKRGASSAKLQGLLLISSCARMIFSQPRRTAPVEPGNENRTVPLAMPPNARDCMVDVPISA